MGDYTFKCKVCEEELKIGENVTLVHIRNGKQNGIFNVCLTKNMYDGVFDKTGINSEDSISDSCVDMWNSYPKNASKKRMFFKNIVTLEGMYHFLIVNIVHSVFFEKLPLEQSYLYPFKGMPLYSEISTLYTDLISGRYKEKSDYVKELDTLLHEVKDKSLWDSVFYTLPNLDLQNSSGILAVHDCCIPKQEGILETVIPSELIFE